MSVEKNVCFCIPARYSSTRLDKKLLLKINDDSCIQKTIKRVLKSAYFNNNIFVFTDNELIKHEISELNCNTILTQGDYCNGTERISKNLNHIPDKYNVVVNVQADEPFISPKNIDEAIDKHLTHNDEGVFYTTLHEEHNSVEFLQSTASLKVVTDNKHNVLYYSRNIIPWNKHNVVDLEYKYKTFTGIYVFDRDSVSLYSKLCNTKLQSVEDCEQLKIIEHGFKIKTYPTVEYNEISLNTEEDYLFLCKKYKEFR